MHCASNEKPARQSKIKGLDILNAKSQIPQAGGEKVSIGDAFLYKPL